MLETIMKNRLFIVFPVLLLLTLSLFADDAALSTATLADPLELLPALELHSRSAILMDATTGDILFAKNEYVPIPPASLTKLMTIYIALSQVEEGRISLDDVVALPPETWGVNQPRGSSLMHLAAGQTVTLRELILGMAIPSGNDAAVAVALHCAPSVAAFAALMNAEASKLGLTNLHFVEPSGISEYNMITAFEFALFCREYIQRYPYTLAEFHTIAKFAYPKSENMPAPNRNRPLTWTTSNHNPLLGVFGGTDGLKTGYIDESGYNLALTALRDGTRIIAISLGAPSLRLRNEDGLALLTWGFKHFKTLRPAPASLPPVPIWKGKVNEVAVVPAETALEFTVRTERGYDLHWETQLIDPIIAPLPAGTQVGQLTLSDSVGELKHIAIIIAEDIERGGFFKRLWDSIRLFFHRGK
jgi:D-alanyl-D-alanine carboxypeptidase (penicillin-binding protein 5/6)